MLLVGGSCFYSENKKNEGWRKSLHRTVWPAVDRADLWYHSHIIVICKSVLGIRERIGGSQQEHREVCLIIQLYCDYKYGRSL